MDKDYGHQKRKYLHKKKSTQLYPYKKFYENYNKRLRSFVRSNINHNFTYHDSIYYPSSTYKNQINWCDCGPYCENIKKRNHVYMPF